MRRRTGRVSRSGAVFVCSIVRAQVDEFDDPPLWGIEITEEDGSKSVRGRTEQRGPVALEALVHQHVEFEAVAPEAEALFDPGHVDRRVVDLGQGSSFRLRRLDVIVKHGAMTGQRSAVVIGGGSGIGADVARLQRDDGIDVLTWDLIGGDVACDVALPEQIDAAATVTLDQLGVPDYVTVSAGVGHSGMLSTVSADEWDRVMNVNARGVLFAMRSLALPMLEASGGSIVALSSVSSRLVDRGMGAYCASKAALDMVVRVAAAEWAPEIRVNAIAPGVTDTPMLGRAPRDGDWLTGVQDRTALGGLGTSEDVARAVLAMHDLPWVTGQVLESDGGLSLHSPINSFAHLPRSPR